MKKYTIEIDEAGKATCSDGYHTFDELYDHRCLLFINLAILMKDRAWWKPHYPGWPALFIETPQGQISYHVPEKYLHMFAKVVPQNNGVWDGHTSNQVLERLTALAGWNQ